MTAIKRMSARYEVKFPLLRVVSHLVQNQYKSLIASSFRGCTITSPRSKVQTVLATEGQRYSSTVQLRLIHSKPGSRRRPE